MDVCMYVCMCVRVRVCSFLSIDDTTRCEKERLQLNVGSKMISGR